MKKFLSLVFACGWLLLSSSACDGLEALKVKKASFTVEYDYGGYEDGKASVLLSGAVPFIPTEYVSSVSPFVAGDELVVKHTGILIFAESYPMIANFSGGKIIGVSKRSAEIVTLEYTQTGLFASSGLTFGEIPQYVVHEDGGFTPLNETPFGTILYGSYALSENTEVELSALYDHMPR